MKYRISVRATVIKTFEVEADNEDEAQELIYEVFSPEPSRWGTGGQTLDHGDGVVELITHERYEQNTTSTYELN